MSENNLQISTMENPVEIKGHIPEDRAIFYDLARSTIIYQNREENRAWQQLYKGRNLETTATYIIGASNVIQDDGNIKRFVNTIQIVVNRGIFEEVSKMINEDCLELIPYEVEHEIYEAWLTAKKGVGQKLHVDKKHLLARRRQFYLAVQDGLGDRLYRFYMEINPTAEEEYKNALEYAKKRLNRTAPTLKL